MRNIFQKNINSLFISKDHAEEMEAVKAIIQSYEQIFESLGVSTFETEEIKINGGIALSPKHAMDCLSDPIRTARFLKGVHTGILKAQEIYKDQPLEIVYAGCGPLATLVLPLLHLFDEKDLNITLLEIHEQSLKNAREIISYCGFDGFIENLFQVDATSYTHNKPIHLLITETMDKGLTKEPQVEITRNLANQLHKDGVLIPEKIKLYHLNRFGSKIARFKDGIPHDIGITSNLREDNHLFTIDKHIPNETFEFVTEKLVRPESFQENPDICVFTRIQVCDDIYLEPSESFITNPITVHNFYAIKEDYQLHYISKPIPNWSIKK